MTTPRVFTRLNHLFLSLIAVTTIAGVVSIPGDAMLPVHWNIYGEPDLYAGRDDALVLMPAFGLGTLILFWAIGRFARPERIAGGKHVMEAVLPVLLAAFLVIQLVLVFRFDFAVARIAACGIGIMLIVLGNVMPKSQPNSYGGIRIGTTLPDPANWSATHRLTGLLMMIAGGLLIVLALFTGHGPVLMAGIAFAVFLPLLVGIIYSLRLARRDRP